MFLHYRYYAEVFNMFVIPGSLCADSDMGHFSLQVDKFFDFSLNFDVVANLFI